MSAFRTSAFAIRARSSVLRTWSRCAFKGKLLDMQLRRVLSVERVQREVTCLGESLQALIAAAPTQGFRNRGLGDAETICQLLLGFGAPLEVIGQRCVTVPHD